MPKAPLRSRNSSRRVGAVLIEYVCLMAFLVLTALTATAALGAWVLSLYNLSYGQLLGWNNPVAASKPSTFSFDSGTLTLAVSSGQNGSTPVSVTLTNNGSTTSVLPPETFTFGGQNPGLFSVASDGCAAGVASGMSCNIAITFGSNSNGTYTASLNNPGVTGSVSLTGTVSGFGPQVTWSNPSISITNPGSTPASSSGTITVHNVGNAPVSGINPSVTGTGWTIGGTTCSTTLAAGASCTITVGLSSTQNGSPVGVVSLGPGLPTDPIQGSVSGFVPPVFPAQSLPGGQQGQPYSGTISATSANNDLVGLTVSSGSLPPGITASASGSSGITFAGTPSQSGSFPITITATDSSGQTSQASYTVSIAPTPPSLSWSGSTTLTDTSSSTETTTLTVTNSGGSPATGLTPGVSGPGFTVSGSTCGQTLASGASCQVTVVWSPSTNGSYTGTVSVGGSNPADTIAATASNVPTSGSSGGQGGTPTNGSQGGSGVASCILALSASAPKGIAVDNMGTIAGTNCGVFSDSGSSSAISLNSGTISGVTVGTVGGLNKSNSGSNTLATSACATSPTTGSFGASAQSSVQSTGSGIAFGGSANASSSVLGSLGSGLFGSSTSAGASAGVSGSVGVSNGGINTSVCADTSASASSSLSSFLGNPLLGATVGASASTSTNLCTSASIGANGISFNASGSMCAVGSASFAFTGAAAILDPFASRTLPTAGACSYTNASFTAYQSSAYAFTQSHNVFCGNTTIGGNGSSDTFAPGIYYIVNGNLTFNNAAVTQAQGVTFVFTGSNPGTLSWTNYSNTTTITAPTSGPTAGITVWQACPANGAANTITLNGGGTLLMSGAIYAPCSQVVASNNAVLSATSGGSLSVVAGSVYATGSAKITGQVSP